MTATHALFKSIKFTLQHSATVCKLHLHCFLYENHPYLSDFQKSIIYSETLDPSGATHSKPRSERNTITQ